MSSHALSSQYSSRVQALRNKHAMLSHHIEEEQKRPSVADFYIKQLKRQRLRIKEQIEGIRQDTGS